MHNHIKVKLDFVTSLWLCPLLYCFLLTTKFVEVPPVAELLINVISKGDSWLQIGNGCFSLLIEKKLFYV